MTWAVFYRPPPEHESVGQSDTASPRFKVPLSRAILNDPAFSPDPRSHPHFPLANAASYKALPSKSHPHPHPSLSSPSLSDESDSDSLISPTSPPSSATSPSQSPTGSPSPVSPLSPSNSISPRPKHPPRRHTSLPVPEILPRLDSTNILASGNLKPLALQNTRRKGRMKALVRRLTSRHNLDRIDELDETDPSGVNYHHDGPYEAIGSNLAHPSLPQRSRGGNIHHSNQPELHPRLFRPNQHRSAFRAPSTHGETGLSLNLEPGQILQQNSIYSSHPSSIVSVPSQFYPQPDTLAIVTRPDHSRRSSLPNTRKRSPDDSSSLEFLNGFQNRPSPSLQPPREYYFRDNTPDIPNTLPLHRDCDVAPYVPRQTETTVFPPPRYESSFQSSGPPRSPQRIPQPSFSPTSQKTQSTESAVPALSPHGPRHKSVHSLDSSYQLNSTFTQSAFSIHNKPLEPPRIRHLPKRLVMPAPLQSQPPQLHYKLPPAEAAAWQDGYPDDHALEGAHFNGPPVMYTHNSRLLRKRSSAFPAKTPIPDHVPMFQDDPVPIMGDSPTKAANEAEGTKERTRRRRLSKRKNDI